MRVPFQFKHGKTFTPEWYVWRAMLARCKNMGSRGQYAERGITVCERWQEFTNFIADMGKRPSPEHTLDRIDNNGNYEPSNCRWISHLLNVQNSRVAKINAQTASQILKLAKNGKRNCEISRELGICQNIVWNVVSRRTWKNCEPAS